MKPGDEVGMKRWPYYSCHPDAWETPRKGILLDVKDPRAWATKRSTGETFPWNDSGLSRLCAGCPVAKQEDVDFAYPRLVLAGNLDPNTTVPVLWKFGCVEAVYWEKLEKLVPYADDLAEWQEARRQACRA